MYNKLVRDRIPEILEKKSVGYNSHVANDREYEEKLLEKLQEEVGEFLKDPCVGELSDVAEVLYAIADLKFGGREELEKIRGEKLRQRGGFEKRLILDQTDNR